ncbi:MAG: hypothetical protein JXR14_07910 [Paracoccaceae bacterium]
MPDIVELERRITAALDRISQGLEQGAARNAEQDAERQAAMEAAIATAAEQAAQEARDAAAAELAAASAQQEASAEQQSAAETELRAELEGARQTNEELISSAQKRKTRIERLERRVNRMSRRLEAATMENLRLQGLVDALRENNDALRAGDTDADDSMTVDEAMEDELADLRARRSADLTELDEIMAELAPLVKEA